MTRRWLVSGRVQGVGFRYFVLRQALALGLTGWTRNLPDGQVEVVAAGPDPALDGLRAALLQGPRHAQVAGVEDCQISDEPEAFKSFDIR